MLSPDMRMWNMRFLVSLALMTVLTPAQSGVNANWKPFRSSNGFVVQYPDNWFLRETSKDRLAILSSRGGAEATIIKSNQAQILVIEEKKFAGSNLSQAMDYYTHETKVLSHKSIQNQNSGPNRCSDLQEVVSTEPIVPSEDVVGSVPIVVNTEYFCQIKGNMYVTVLRNFQGNKNQPKYQHIALDIAKSLRVE